MQKMSNWKVAKTTCVCFCQALQVGLLPDATMSAELAGEETMFFLFISSIYTMRRKDRSIEGIKMYKQFFHIEDVSLGAWQPSNAEQIEAPNK